MKFKLLILILYQIMIINSNDNFNDFILTEKSEAFLLKECEKINSALCEKYKNMKLNSKENTKVKSRVAAQIHSNDNNKTSNNHELFNLALPINTCKTEDCEFCCLSTNRCGTKKQCLNSQYYTKILNYIFASICTILLSILVIKFYYTDAQPDQMGNEKIDNTDLSELISMFSIIRNNRKKLIT